MQAGKARWRSHNIYDNRAPSAIKAAFDAAKGSMEGGMGLVSDRVEEQQE